jgi:surface protein
MNGWDVRKVTNMSYMFSSTPQFNGNVSGWDVSSVTDISNMFQGATSFNGNDAMHGSECMSR